MLVAPQLLITLIFFFLPAGQAIEQSVMMQDAFGLSNEFVGLANFQTLFADPNYIESFKVTMLFSVLVAGIGLAVSLLFAVCADRVLRGGNAYKSFLRDCAGRRGRSLDVHLQSDLGRSLLCASSVRV